MTEDAQSTAGFAGHLCYVVGLREVVVDVEAQKFKRLNLFQLLTMEIERSASLSIFLDIDELLHALHAEQGPCCPIIP